MEWQGGNKQRPDYWQWRRSFIRRFELEIFPSRLPCGHVFEPKLNAQQGAICEAFFWKCFEQSTSWCFGSHFFVARSHRFIAICHCRFLRLHLKTKTKFKKKHGKKTPLSTFHCNELQHTRSACFKTDLPDHFRFNFVQVVLSHAGQVSCCDVTEVTDRDRNAGFFSCRRRRCSKRRVCFHSNQYFYVPQENVNLSNVC